MIEEHIMQLIYDFDKAHLTTDIILLGQDGHIRRIQLDNDETNEMPIL